MNKKGRKAYPEHIRAKTTSLRLRPDRLALFKKLGGTEWLNDLLDAELASYVAAYYNMDLVSSINYVKDIRDDYILYFRMLKEDANLELDTER